MFKHKEDKKIFVIFNTAFIGDILINNALVQNIKHYYPESKVVFVVQPQFRDVALYQRGVDDVITFNKKKDNNLFGFIKFLFNFPYKKIFASFVIYSNDRNLILSRLIGAKHIITEQRNTFTKLMSTKEKYPLKQYKHMKDISTGMIEALTNESILDFPIVYEPPYIETGLEKDKHYIAITATSKFYKKDMPVEMSKELINLIIQDGKIPVMLGAGEVAREYVETLRKLGCTNFVDMTDKTNFIQLTNILKQVDALVTVDTGTMHFGNALNIPTVAVFFHGCESIWAPREDLYNTIVLSNKTANDIFTSIQTILNK